MKPTDAVALDNWFPRTTDCVSRGGNTEHAAGLTNNGKTLAVYNAASGSNKLFAATASGIYDVSTAGAVGAAAVSRTSGKHQWLNFGDGTNFYLMMFNGVDAPAFYDGSSWIEVTTISSPALTGITPADVISAFDFKGRLMLILKSYLGFGYLTAGAAGGAVSLFPLDGDASEGGYVMAGMAWSRDAGDGPDDFAAFVTSEGQVLVFQGTNPASANTWAKVGTYKIGKPLGRRCLVKYGGDIVVLTQNGAFPLSAALQTDEAERSKLALSFKVENAFNEAAAIYGSNFGWCATLFPGKSAMLVNVPVAEDGTHYQYVMNTITKAWCRFLGWNAEDFAIFNGELYFTSGTAVYKAWNGTADNDEVITLYGKTAFQYFGDFNVKQFLMFRPVLRVNGTLQFLTDIDVDFRDNEITGTAEYTVTAGALWDVALWDEAYWAAGMDIVKEWTSPDEWDGRCASAKLKIVTDSITIEWAACDILYQRGAGL